MNGADVQHSRWSEAEELPPSRGQTAEISVNQTPESLVESESTSDDDTLNSCDGKLHLSSSLNDLGSSYLTDDLDQVSDRSATYPLLMMFGLGFSSLIIMQLLPNLSILSAILPLTTGEKSVTK